MKTQTLKMLEMILNADTSVSDAQKLQAIKILGQKPDIPVKIYLAQQEVAQTLSVSRQTVHNMVKQGVLNPVDINRQGLMRYRLDELQKLGC